MTAPMAGNRRILRRIANRAAESFGRRLRRLRLERGWTQVELARRANINQGFLSQIERDEKLPSTRMLDALATALEVPQAVLLGAGADHDAPQRLDTRELPLFGTIPAGPPSESQEQLEMFPVLRHQWSPDFYCLRLEFDSMEPTLKPGDIVLVHYRPDVDPEHVPGRICACLVNGQPTLKRVWVEWRGDDRLIVLRGDNPRTQPVLVDTTADFSIQGIVVRLVGRDL
ncbi:MAG: helix-turn-helix domain-containing protein [Phycisphaerales bacterium]|nr:MAG: helix-turn-helix domain-containing protein [Phycisphaerales bacterium]